MNARTWRATLVLATLALGGTLACASSGGPRPSSADRNTLTQEELAEQSTQTLYQAIQRLRPQWLQARSAIITAAGPPDLPQVYVDGAPGGDVEALRNILATEVLEVTYMEAIDATTRFGINHTGGAILVRTR